MQLIRVCQKTILNQETVFTGEGGYDFYAKDRRIHWDLDVTYIMCFIVDVAVGLSRETKELCATIQFVVELQTLQWLYRPMNLLQLWSVVAVISAALPFKKQLVGKHWFCPLDYKAIPLQVTYQSSNRFIWTPTYCRFLLGDYNESCPIT